MMAAVVPGGQYLMDKPFVPTVEGVRAMQAVLQQAGYVPVKDRVEPNEAACELRGLME